MYAAVFCVRVVWVCCAHACVCVSFLASLNSTPLSHYFLGFGSWKVLIPKGTAAEWRQSKSRRRDCQSPNQFIPIKIKKKRIKNDSDLIKRCGEVFCESCRSGGGASHGKSSVSRCWRFFSEWLRVFPVSNVQALIITWFISFRQIQHPGSRVCKVPVGDQSQHETNYRMSLIAFCGKLFFFCRTKAATHKNPLDCKHVNILWNILMSQS